MAHVEWLLALNGEAGKRVSERVLQRKPDDDGTHRRGGEQLVVEHERGDEQNQADDDELLKDGRKRDRERDRRAAD